jgi:hypothetical protein
MSTSRTVVSDTTPTRNSLVNLESQSLRSNPNLSISPSLEVFRMTTTTTPHSLRRPDEAMPNPAEIHNDMDDVSEINSIHSAVSQSSQDILIPAPPMSEYMQFMEWLTRHFQEYVSGTFETFLIDRMRLQSIKDLNDFITRCTSKSLHSYPGSATYDEHRKSIIELKIIWTFFQLPTDIQSRTGYRKL